ncbi:chemotaxis protein histidine kinase-like protein [Desulfosporosinus orientis DSM 765]|uniref:Chemotaxis protein CheA n=1 Tax=Desulfosporosinus orientis (strain ATCC 19365 / DSM 765 / NCIMB 8382 / VKM B-1628 / Singapore I) TaxID=768706 RepID=G7WHZ9_DESOD|nr:chemotaxis protein CheA [Desulfosporosinus orientis]AET70296.1 chemotaxis protein histidine kinase-like protein [Desulfosporosinus orientis DSM 765]
MTQDDDNKQGVELGEFLEFYLLDSQEQIERLGAGLLQLEKEGENIGLINDLFRSAHSLKGASGTMGFTPIVSLTHAAEDLLDRLRQGQLEVSLEMIDILLAVTDRVKAMLSQVEQHQDITIGFKDLVSSIRSLLSGEKAESVKTAQPVQVEAEVAEQFVPRDFLLSQDEREKLDNAFSMGRTVYQVDVTLEPNTLMKAVRAVMATQRIESMGSVIKLLPSIEELEAGNANNFSMLILSDESGDEIKRDLLEISELVDVQVRLYPNGEGVKEKVSDLDAVQIEEKIEPALKQEDIGTPKKGPLKAAAPPAAINTGEGNNQVHTIRVDTVRMDNLINLVGEMVITRTRLVQIGLDLKTQYSSDSMVNSLNEANVYLGRLMNDLQESVMRLRMVAIGTVFNRFPRLIRDLAKKTKKEINLVLKGEDTELDKTVVEVIGDPLMHLIRNSVDHGIESPEERRKAGKPETGTITLNAYHEGNHIAILISDDGAGLDLEKIHKIAISKGLVGEREELSERDIANLIFLPGFSTAEKVTDISGRGVGMDVVKKALNNLGGMVDITTRRGKGSTFTIRLPLTLAIIQALLVEVSQEIYAVPLSSVLETLLVSREDIKTVGGLPMVQLRGNTLPLISLQEKFELPASEAENNEVFVVVVGFGDKALGLIVDELRGQQEVVIKSLGDFLNNLPGIAGATILGDGKVTLILDIGSLIQDVLVTRRSS